MRTRTRPAKLAVLVSAVSVLLVPALAVSAAVAKPEPPGKPITVMTRNVYLGADIMRPIRAIEGATNEQDLLFRLGMATHQTRLIVDETDFERRGELLAAEIADVRPDLIGLQEVAIWRSGPLELDKLAVPNATDIDYDFLQILLDELAERGQKYRAVSVSEESDVEAPSFAVSPFETGAQDIRLTMHDVVLMRDGGGLSVLDEGTGHYDANLSIAIGGQELSFGRGFNWVDVRAGAKEFRFVNTHFEAFSSDIAYDQAAELLAGPANHDGTTIIACDCNSDPLNTSVKTGIGDTHQHNDPYELITGSGGFTDSWLEWKPAEEGWTAGLNETVDEPNPTFTHRIDMIFARTASGNALSVDKGEVTGNELSDKDPVTGLWPSDHAGVVLRLRGPVS